VERTDRDGLGARFAAQPLIGRVEFLRTQFQAAAPQFEIAVGLVVDAEHRGDESWQSVEHAGRRAAGLRATSHQVLQRIDVLDPEGAAQLARQQLAAAAHVDSVQHARVMVWLCRRHPSP
jgi:hypothetical protein